MSAPDEPANIALSDYSSLSSGDDFSSCDEDNRNNRNDGNGNGAGADDEGKSNFLIARNRAIHVITKLGR